MKIKYIIFIIALLYGCSCTNTTIKKDVILNEKDTIRRINIPNTRLSIIPPKGFRLLENSGTLQNEKNSKIIIIDNINENFYLFKVDFNKVYKNNNIKIFEKENFILNKYNALLIHGQENEKYEHYYLYFGDSTFIVYITAFYPIEDKLKLENQIKKSFMTIEYDKSLIIDPLKNAVFICDTNSKFIFQKINGNSYIFFLDNKPTDYASVDVFPYGSTTPKTMSIADQFISTLKSNGLKNITIKRKNKKIKKYDAEEVEIIGYYQNEIFKMNILVLTSEKYSLLIAGRTKDDYNSFKKNFYKFAYSIKFKE
ncbi:MAG: hypothetical protein PHC83_04125 [Bacteroidales bacterium]|nr:hypothetical protein [Bacteroidales bacterium]